MGGGGIIYCLRVAARARQANATEQANHGPNNNTNDDDDDDDESRNELGRSGGLLTAGHRRPGDGADDDGVEEEAEAALLLLDLEGPAGEAEAAEGVVGGAGRDVVGAAAGGGELALEAAEGVLVADAEGRRVEPDVGAREPRQLDVADARVRRLVLVPAAPRPRHPLLLHQRAPQPQLRRHRRHLPRVVRLHPADADQRVAALRQRLGRQVSGVGWWWSLVSFLVTIYTSCFIHSFFIHSSCVCSL